MKPKILRSPNQVAAQIEAPTFANVSAAMEALTLESVPETATMSLTSNVNGWFIVARFAS
jgi:hypothetical protein